MTEDIKQPIFTIVTVCYNCIDTIEATIKSVILQDFKDYEFIIIDGGSTDGTVDIIKRYANNLTYWSSEKDNGIYDGMNKGIKHAKGEWIEFLNCGDLFVDFHVLTNVNEHISNDIDIIYGDIIIEKHGEMVVKEALEPCNKQRMYFCHQSAFVRTSIMKKMPYDLRYKMSADFHFFKCCYYQGLNFSHLHTPLVIYDRNGVSNTNRLSGLEDNVRVIKSLDHGMEKFKLLAHLYFVIYRIKLLVKSRKRSH